VHENLPPRFGSKRPLPAPTFPPSPSAFVELRRDQGTTEGVGSTFAREFGSARNSRANTGLVAASNGAINPLFIRNPMSQFTSQLFLRSFSAQEVTAAGSEAQLYEVTHDFTYLSDKLGRVVTVPGRVAAAPIGFVTDFASIPRAAWEIIDPEDPIIAWPSVIHDYLYSCKGKLPDGFAYNREKADAVLREGMQACGASSLIRNAVYQAVRLGGGSHWQR